MLVSGSRVGSDDIHPLLTGGMTMLRNILKIRKTLAILMLAGAGFHSPIAAEGSDVSDCYERVLEICADALEDANWIESVGVGILCVGMLAGCLAEVIS
jgi:hypothetical protein